MPQPPRANPVPPEPSVRMEHLSDEQLRQLSLSTSVVIVKGRLLLGRCMVEIMQRDLLPQWGFSGINQYAQYYLQMDPDEAKEARRVARRLVELPLISEAAEAGRIRWSYLLQIVRIATRDTEEEWLQAATSLRSFRRLKRMVDRAIHEVPEDPNEPPISVMTEVRLKLIPEEAELQQAAVATLSTQAGRPLTGREAHVELYRLVVEGNLRTSPRGVEQTEGLIEELIRLRQEQDEKDRAAVQEELQRAAAEGGVNVPPPAGAEPEEAPAPWPTEPPAAVPPFVHQSEPQDAPPTLPWAAALVEELACPGNPDLLVVTSTSRKAKFPEIPCPCSDCRKEGPRSRHIPADVRRKVLRRDGFRCACPDCPYMIWIDLHHLVFWCDGGLSVPKNLIVLCRRCHRNLHRGLLRIQGNPEDGLLFLDREGRPLASTSPASQVEAARFAEYSLRCAWAMQSVSVG